MVNNQAKMVIEREDSWQRAIGMAPNFWRLSLIIKPCDCSHSLNNHTDLRTFVLVKFAVLSSYLMVNIKRFFSMNIFACFLCYRTEFPKLSGSVEWGGEGILLGKHMCPASFAWAHRSWKWSMCACHKKPIKFWFFTTTNVQNYFFNLINKVAINDCCKEFVTQ